MTKMRLTYFAIEPMVEGHASHTHVTEIIKGFKRRGWKVALVHSHLAHIGAGIWRRLWHIGGALLRFFVARKGNAVYMRMHPAAFPAALQCRLAGVAYFVEVNGQFADVYIAWPQARYFRWLLDRLMILQLVWARELFPVTPLLGDYVRRIDPRLARAHITAVPNGADTGQFRPGLPRPAIAGGSPLPATYALLYGTLAQWQGVGTAMAAARDPHWPDGLDLVIIGSGRLASTAAAMARQCSNIHYVGTLPYESIAAVVANAAVGLVLTENVGGRLDTGVVPLKMIEMMASSVPLVVTDQPGQREIVAQHDCGLIVPEQTPKDVAKSVATILGDPALSSRMGRNGRHTASRNFNWDTLAGRIASQIEAKLGGETPARPMTVRRQMF